MIDYDPRQRPTLDQIQSCDLCHDASHSSAIQTLKEGRSVWNRRHPKNTSLPDMTHPPSDCCLIKSFCESPFRPHHQLLPPLSSRSELLSIRHQASTIDTLFSMTSSSSSPSSLDNLSSHSAIGTTTPSARSSPVSSLLGDPLFQSPASRSISKWAEAQHLKCEQSLHYLKNIHSSLRIAHLETPKQKAPTSIIKVVPFTPAPKKTLERLMSSPSNLFNRLPTLPPPRCSSFSTKK
jgi:hypothetical protein